MRYGQIIYYAAPYIKQFRLPLYSKKPEKQAGSGGNAKKQEYNFNAVLNISISTEEHYKPHSGSRAQASDSELNVIAPPR